MDVSIHELMNTVFSFTLTLMLTFFIREAQTVIAGTTCKDYLVCSSNAPDSGNIRKTGLKTDIFLFFCIKYLLAIFVDDMEVFEDIYMVRMVSRDQLVLLLIFDMK